MSVTHLETDPICKMSLNFKTQIQTFDQCVSKMDAITQQTLENWIGKGRNEFQVQAALMKRQLDDLSDNLYAMYDDLVEAEKTYIDQDIAVAKQFSSIRADQKNDIAVEG